MSSSFGTTRAIAWAFTALVAAGATACLDGTDDDVTTTSLAVIGQCVRNEAVLRAPEPASCATDAGCPCGSFCDPVEHRCTFECMVPPANIDESCPTGQQCDDRGQCVTPGSTPASLAPVLAVTPPVLEVAPAAASPQQLSVKLSVNASSGTAVTQAQSTVVRVVASDDIEVSCDATTFGHECQLTAWTFAWNGTRSIATKPMWARTTPSNTDGHGQVTLFVQSTETTLVVPAASAAASLVEGSYVGVAASPGVSTGVPVEVRAHGGFLVVRDPSQIIAPDGALLLDLLTDAAQVPTARRTVWLRSPGSDPNATLVGEYKASGLVTFDPATGALSAGFTITLPGPQSGPTTDAWTLQLQRTGDYQVECSSSSDCATGNECPSSLGVCVPTAVVTPPTAAVANQLADARSLTWWNAIVGLLGTSDTTPDGSAFATSGADLIETLLCTTDDTDAGAGRIGPRQVKLGSDPSRSGDLRCVNNGGSATSVPGAVGLVTYADRVGPLGSLALLGTCLQDLARAPAGFANDFATGTGQCANLARFVPALRLLATGELGKHTKINDRRTRGLFVRLLQQWSQLHGFIASTGLSEREYDDAVAATPAEARQGLVSLLDVIDAGWAGLLDSHIAPAVATAAALGPTDTDSTDDYREAKKPVVYWPFNGNSNPQRDIVRGLDLTQRLSNSNTACQILTTRNSINHGYNCPGFRATLPADAPSIGGNKDLSVSMYIQTPTDEFPPYFGGTLFQTETLAAVNELADRQMTLTLVHPTADGGTEYVGFDWVYGFAGTSVAIVRDTQAMTYTVYIYEAWKTNPQVQVFTQRYYHEVGGVLPGTAERRIQLMNGWSNFFYDRRAQIGQFPRNQSFAGIVDDFAIFDSKLSKREFTRFASARKAFDNHTDTYPEPITLTAHGTQEINVSVGASLLETQAAHLDVVTRFAQHMTYESQAACEGEDAAARANLEAGIARAGQAVRQSFVIENLARTDTSTRANDARKLLQAKRSTIARTLQRLRSCANPYGMAEGEVPLYFGEVTGETGAFFAASDHLLGLAEPRAQAASNALLEVQGRWDQARQSQIQELQNDTARAIRVEEVESRFVDQLKRLCGTPDTTEQILQQLHDGTFSVDTCFVKPTTQCLAAHTGGPITDADPTCYRGVLGAQLMGMREAYHAQQAAYQAWQAAVGNSDGAERQCVLMEMDAFGCSALDRHELEGVECPPNYQGTIELVTEFNRYVADREEEGGWFNALVTTVSTVAQVATAVATTGPGAGFLLAAKNSLGLLGPEMDRSMAQRKRQHELVLQKRAAEAAIRACWTEADQYERAIASAEESSLRAKDAMQTSIINFENALAETREVALEAPIVIQRELTRPSIPIAFHYWLPEKISTYRFLLESARRYAYVALRATEYDSQESYTAPQIGKPSRAAVLGAWRPDALLQQLSLMRDATNDRRTGNGRPSADHLVLDVAKDIFGLSSAESLADNLEANARPVYSRNGEYLGQGVRFTFLPAAAADVPSWRCAERLMRANVAAVGFDGALRVKLLKRTVFGSRRCADNTIQVATLQPTNNLLVASGDPQTYVEPLSNSVADIDVVNLNIAGNVDAFHYADEFADGASTELAGQGLYGDYVLLFTAPSLSAGLTLSDLEELYVRFDFVSVDNLPSTNLLRPGEVMVEQSIAPIIVD